MCAPPSLLLDQCCSLLRRQYCLATSPPSGVSTGWSGPLGPKYAAGLPHDCELRDNSQRHSAAQLSAADRAVMQNAGPREGRRPGAAPAPPASALGWTTTILNGAVRGGAVCLDGTAPGYHIQTRDPRRWTVHLQGGGWCTSVQDCFSRSNGPLGSSKSYAADMDGILAGYDGGAHGILSSDSAVNPDFHNHTKVYVRYCDGASFAGNLGAPVTAPGKRGRSVHFRGWRVLDAVLDSLIEVGLGQAELFIVNGCSAGGLAVYLHLDYIQSRLPGVRVVGVPEAGFFMDETRWDGNASTGYTPSYKRVAQMQNVSGGVNGDCVAAAARGEAWRCFMAQYTLPHIRTPYFIVNSLYDAWQVRKTPSWPTSLALFTQECMGQLASFGPT